MYLNKPNSHIMIALDTKDKEEAFRVMDECYDLVDAIKLNYPLILTEGIEIIKELKEKYKLPIVTDLKVADAPVTNNRIIKIAIDNSVDAIMIHGFIGSDAILEMKKIADKKIGIIIVTELTHPGGLEFTRQHAEDFAKMAVLLNCYGIQAPGTRPKQIRNLRNIVGKDKVIVSCGVGAQGGKFKEAIDAGADFAIIGRAIYDNPFPRRAVEELIQQLDK